MSLRSNGRNSCNPLTQHIVKTCDIDEDAGLLRPARLRRVFAAASFTDVVTADHHFSSARWADS
ncbi:hypothetical protein MTX23_26615 [Bradyrhizobium sp. ISRA436]|uniref:hypothetical protein n=1 Tax=unclassified Bradyrhizobium TaxID=2631580 RepID=UPI00247904ED|nr:MULTISPECIES: hypothetical protein [unclassified Bradyrhizobium]WGR97909.1 hypothetical protein MTX23_26615 [Bradyrhizobium sp. ISRA436]WGS04799.1 hypothetical protein MTX18_26625 [Bradyrhizobium sp. ISRA437]